MLQELAPAQVLEEPLGLAFVLLGLCLLVLQVLAPAQVLEELLGLALVLLGVEVKLVQVQEGLAIEELLGLEVWRG